MAGQGWLETPFSLEDKTIWVAGHTGMVGSACVRRLKREDLDIITPDKRIDLREQSAVRHWLAEAKPDVIVLAAAKVGGIGANSNFPAEFIYDNLMIEANIIHAAYEAGVEKLIFLGSSCIYPKEAAQPIAPEALLSGPLEPTNAPYAIAKIAGVALCQSYRRQYGCDFNSVMPCNLYGPGDTYDVEKSHVIPAMVLKFRTAIERGESVVTLWGSGAPLREFMHVDDLADAILFVLRNFSGAEVLNIGSGEEISIFHLAHLIAELTGYCGEIVWDKTMPDGVTRKCLDTSSLITAGWKPSLSLKDGLKTII